MLSDIVEKLYSIQRPKRQENIVETTYFIRFIRKLAGASVITIKCTPDRVKPAFTWLGFTCFIVWYASYFYCMIIVTAEDQTILRSLYNTKMQRYGDDVERFVVSIFMLYAMWKVPFDLSGSTEDVQLIIEIDKTFQVLNEPMIYTSSRMLAFVLFVMQWSITGTRIFSVWVSHYSMRMPMPPEKIFQMIFSDAIIFIITAQYCSYLLILKRRYRILNRVLNSIRLRTPSKLFKFRYQYPNVPHASANISDDICRKMKTCGRIYSMLYSATETANNKFGLILFVMMFMTLLFTILYFYYFMEATASGLFHDPDKYINFIVYVFWQIAYAITIMLVCISFSEKTVKEALVTPQVIHKIINSDLGSAIETEAINLSLQVVHQRPTFTAYGLFKLDYVMVLEGTRSVITFLVILLQFVTDKR